MVIRIVGKDLRFDGGVAMLCEWGSLWQHEAVQRTGYCSHNLIRDVELAAPGRYFL